MNTPSTRNSDFVEVPPEMRSPAYIPPGDLESFDRRGARPKKRGQTEYSVILRQADKAMIGEKFPKERRERICQLLDCVWPNRLFARGPEAKEVAELLENIVRPDRLMNLLRQAEQGNRIRRGTALALDAARRLDNPYRFLAEQIQRELRLLTLTSQFRREGRPPTFMAALVADSVADEVKVIYPRWIWPMVAKILRAYFKQIRPPISGDPEQVRQRVVGWKRTIARKVAKGATSESWDDAKALLYQHAGLNQA